MFRNYFKVAFRSMKRHAAYSFINILGLAVGMVVGFFVLLWVRDELSYDRFHEDVDQVYRVMRTAYFGEGQVFTWPAITYKLDGVLDEEYPEIEYVAAYTWEEELAFRRGAVTFREKGRYADRDFFRILDYDFIMGDPNTALQAPDAVVLTASMASKYFPDIYERSAGVDAARTVMGMTLLLENRQDLTVTGIIADPPETTSLSFTYVIALGEWLPRNDWVDDWGNNGLRMVARLSPGVDVAAVNTKIKNLIPEESGKADLFLQPYTDIYLKSRFENGRLVGGRIETVRLFVIVGIFILLIAAINFMNLATARSAQRAMEVGIRKTFGSSRSQLAGQFLGESTLTALLAFGVAVALTLTLLPSFNQLTGKSISLLSASPVLWLQMLAIALGTGLLAGLYPAAYLSAFTAIGVIRRSQGSTSRGVILRRGLVVLQFGLSILLVIGATTVHNQVSFIREKNLGLDRKDMFYATLEGPMKDQYESYRTALLEYPSIQSVTSTSHSPLFVGSSTSGGVSWEGKDDEDNTLYHILQVNHDFVETMKMQIVQGRDFSRAFTTDTVNVLINEKAAEVMGFEQAVGQRVRVWGRDGQIVGIVGDFHISSLHDAIEPLVIRLNPEQTGVTYVRPAAGQTVGALAAFENVFRAFNAQYPFQYEFVDAEFERTYRSEIVVGTLSRWFTGLAIFIACLGLFGLASFTAERRTKEIGIRKVLGASVLSVVGLLSREFIVLVGIAFALAAPLAYLLMDRWLSDFAYHTEIGWLVFAGTALLIVVISYLTVGYQSLRAALTNPADALRTE